MSDERGWPGNSGYRLRTAQILSALAAIGPVTWIAAPRNRDDPGGPLMIPDRLQTRIDAKLVPAPGRSRMATAKRWLGGELPWPLAAGDWTRVIEELRTRGDGGYRVIWSMGLDALGAVRRAGIEAPVMIVDADLESLKLRRQLDSGGVEGVLRRLIAVADVGRWQRLERRAAGELTGFSLCSDDELAVLGAGGFVTPNSYPPVDDRGRCRRDLVRDELLFIGSLGYQPNIDGLRWFVDCVLPPLRQRHPRLSLRVVGSGPVDRLGLEARDGVVLVGAVDDVGTELDRAAAVVVPIRWGAGTRIKILEAFAHRLPVVSTTIGAEGLAVRSGDQLLLADDGSAFAEACSSILARPEDAVAMADRAHRLFAQHYEESVVSHRLVERIEQMLGVAG